MTRTREALIERHMRNWELARQQESAGIPQGKSVYPFITISRTVGSGGAAVAQALAQKIGWPLFDREILQEMSGDDGVRKRLYETMDERDLSFIEESLRTFTESDFQRHDYFPKLTKTVLAIARKQSSVFLGRASELILPDDVGLRVKIVAPWEQRVEAYARRTRCDIEKAASEVDRIDEERADFVQRHFNIDTGNIERFDLCICLSRLTVEDATLLVEQAMRARGVLS